MKAAARCATLIVLAGMAMVALLVAYNLYHYETRLTDLHGFLYYCVFPIVVLASLAAVLRLGESARINVVLVLVSSTSALYVTEQWLALRETKPIPTTTFAAAAAKAGVPFDTRSKFDVVQQLAARGLDVYPSLHPATTIIWEQRRVEINGRSIVPLGGISKVLTVYCNENGEYTIYDSDEHGFNNPRGLYARDNIDIVAVGDSMTHGACVSPETNAVARIRGVYSGTLNLAVGGDGPLLELATLKEYGRPRRPGVVLWFYSETDIPDVYAESQHPILAKYLTRDFRQDLPSIQPAIDQALKKIVNAAKRNEFRAEQHETMREAVVDEPVLRLLLLSRTRRRIGFAIDRKVELFQQILMTAKEESESWGGRLYLVYIPLWGSVEREHPYRRSVLRIAKELNLPVIDVQKALAAQRDPLSFFPFRLPGHYNEEGQKLIAETVLRCLKTGSC